MPDRIPDQKAFVEAVIHRLDKVANREPVRGEWARARHVLGSAVIVTSSTFQVWSRHDGGPKAVRYSPYAQIKHYDNITSDDVDRMVNRIMGRVQVIENHYTKRDNGREIVAHIEEQTGLPCHVRTDDEGRILSVTFHGRRVLHRLGVDINPLPADAPTIYDLMGEADA